MTKNKSNSKFLLDSSPMIFYPEVAKILGTNEAIFIQQLNYWIQKNDSNPTHFKEGRIWVYNKLEEWQEYNFVMWSISTIRRILDNLVSKKIIIKKKFNLDKDKWNKDHTLWYTIDYDVLDQYLLECEKPENQRKKYKNLLDIANAENIGSVQSEQMSNINGSEDVESSNVKVENTNCGKPVDIIVDNSNSQNGIVRKQPLNSENMGSVQSEQKHMSNMNKSNCSNWANLHITETTTTETTITERDNNVSAETPLPNTNKNFEKLVELVSNELELTSENIKELHGFLNQSCMYVVQRAIIHAKEKSLLQYRYIRLVLQSWISQGITDRNQLDKYLA